MNNPIDSTGVFDSRDLIEYKEYLADELISMANDKFEDKDDFVEVSTVEEIQNYLDTLDEPDCYEFGDELEEYTDIEDFCNELDGYGDFEYGESIISEDYFTEYSEELCKEIGEISSDLPWYIENHINWEGVASELKADYMEVDFQGTTYLMRA